MARRRHSMFVFQGESREHFLLVCQNDPEPQVQKRIRFSSRFTVSWQRGCWQGSVVHCHDNANLVIFRAKPVITQQSRSDCGQWSYSWRTEDQRKLLFFLLQKTEETGHIYKEHSQITRDASFHCQQCRYLAGHKSYRFTCLSTSSATLYRLASG